MATIQALARHQLLAGRRALRPVFGYRIRWLARLLYGRLHKSNALEPKTLEQKLLEVIDTSPSYYIEVGANDGEE